MHWDKGVVVAGRVIEVHRRTLSQSDAMIARPRTTSAVDISKIIQTSPQFLMLSSLYPLQIGILTYEISSLLVVVETLLLL